MLSLVVVVDKKEQDVFTRDMELSLLVAQYKIPFEIVYVTGEDNPNINAIKTIATKYEHRQFICNEIGTSINTQIYSAIENTCDGDVFLLTIDTSLQVVSDVLAKYIKGNELVFVRQKKNWFHATISAFGNFFYKLGLSILGRNYDMLCDTRVILLNNRSVNAIILNPVLSKAMRIFNPDIECKSSMVTSPIITERQINDNERKPARMLFNLGFVSIFYFLTLITMALIYPALNGGVYSWWVLGALILWLSLGLIGSTYIAKQIFNARLGSPVAVDLNGTPVTNIIMHYNSDKALTLDLTAVNPTVSTPKEQTTVTQQQPTAKIEKVSENKTTTSPKKAISSTKSPTSTKKSKTTTKTSDKEKTTKSSTSKSKAKTTTKSTKAKTKVTTNSNTTKIKPSITKASKKKKTIATAKKNKLKEV